MKLIVLLLLAIPSTGIAQNLVPNPGFEEYENCEDGNVITAMEFVSEWVNPNAWSSDYFKNFELPCAVNTNGATNTEYLAPQPFEGNSFVGSFYSLAQSVGEKKEYIQVQLNQPLIEGQVYEVSWWVSMAAKSKYRVNRMGAYFSNQALFDPFEFNAFEVDPQIEITDYFGSPQEWLQIIDTIWADGGENFLTIGCFAHDLELGLEQIAFGENLYEGAYYVIDQVEVVAIPVGISETSFLSFNPVIHQFQDYIEVSTPSSKRLRCDCFNSLGGIIGSSQRDESTTIIDTRSYSSGVYILRCTQDAQHFSIKYLKIAP